LSVCLSACRYVDVCKAQDHWKMKCIKQQILFILLIYYITVFPLIEAGSLIEAGGLTLLF